ncbi:hypothetical protein DVA67_018575 [Solirubrobacter sp. CPCC 204708]|uniref:Uncharacterized protein n=1 Tax=Solirubrobacter deserti TaxID=2282478 RepID=A0ABT4RM75_9ACTN|nr:hypothetical protein [Solirubrobacter deserti]MBE2317993.1 hypothetical protein [Solirubrobacter deserti]MDA0139672.1 hypothetical protein [Solirubrobacter deserti]
MTWLIGIASLWLFVCLLAVSLCAMARRGDDALAALAYAREEDEEVGFVAAFAEPQVAPERVRPQPAPRSAR